jgi:hypothetical protein
VFRVIEFRANLLEIEVSEMDGISMKLNLYYHLHCSKQCITFARIIITFALENPTFARITPPHLHLFFQGKYR